MEVETYRYMKYLLQLILPCQELCHPTEKSAEYGISCIQGRNILYVFDCIECHFSAVSFCVYTAILILRPMIDIKLNPTFTINAWLV